MIIEHSEAKALLVSDRLFTKLSRQTIDRLNVVVRTKNLGVIAHTRAEGAVGIPKPEDLAVIIYTSGTTSNPRGDADPRGALQTGRYFGLDLPGRRRGYVPFGAAAVAHL